MNRIDPLVAVAVEKESYGSLSNVPYLLQLACCRVVCVTIHLLVPGSIFVLMVRNNSSICLRVCLI